MRVFFSSSKLYPSNMNKIHEFPLVRVNILFSSFMSSNFFCHYLCAHDRNPFTFTALRFVTTNVWKNSYHTMFHGCYVRKFLIYIILFILYISILWWLFTYKYMNTSSFYLCRSDTLSCSSLHVHCVSCLFVMDLNLNVLVFDWLTLGVFK